MIIISMICQMPHPPRVRSFATPKPVDPVKKRSTPNCPKKIERRSVVSQSLPSALFSVIKNPNLFKYSIEITAEIIRYDTSNCKIKSFLGEIFFCHLEPWNEIHRHGIAVLRNSENNGRSKGVEVHFHSAKLFPFKDCSPQ